MASGQLATCRTPLRLTSGRVRRSSPRPETKPKRPLSQSHSSFTSGASPAWWRLTWWCRWSARISQPPAQWSQEVVVDFRSNGRAWKRYAAEVSAPTGQICTTLPEKYES